MMDRGASPLRDDRAGHEPSPTVSALRVTIPSAAAHVLCRAHRKKLGEGYWIDRSLGWRAWETRGMEGRKDIAPLYAHGLVTEWFSPPAPPLLVTELGEAVRSELRKAFGYD